MDSDLRLKRMFAKLNRRYWSGELPADTCVWWEPCGDTFGKTNLVEDANIFAIRIDPSILGMGVYTELILTHEMAHVATWLRTKRLKDHGGVFDAEIQRLTGYRSYRKLL